jgi:hypothetical protein
MKPKIEKFTNIQIREVFGKNLPEQHQNRIYNHNYGPIYPCFEKYKHLLHVVKSGVPVISDIPKADDSLNIETIHTPLFWCGRLHEHYGHLICEQISRILVYKESQAKGKLCFSIFQNQKIKDFFWQIIAHFGYSREDVILIDKPVIAKTLYVTPQNEMLYQAKLTSEYYLDLLDKNYSPKPLCEKKGIIYISRSKMPNYPKLGGEKYLESYFRKCGIKVVYPEKLLINEQLEIYNSSRCIIMTEGSAYHTFQLFGRALGDVLIIKRRNQNHFDWVKNFILPRCNSIKFIRNPYVLLGSHPNINKKILSLGKGIVIYQMRLIEEITNYVKSIDKNIPNVEASKREYDEQVWADYKNYIKKEAEIIFRIQIEDQEG